MKLVTLAALIGTNASRPARALWIEILPQARSRNRRRSRPARALWIEIILIHAISVWAIASRPARALWIEIDVCPKCHGTGWVEAREGLVD